MSARKFPEGDLVAFQWQLRSRACSPFTAVKQTISNPGMARGELVAQVLAAQARPCSNSASPCQRARPPPEQQNIDHWFSPRRHTPLLPRASLQLHAFDAHARSIAFAHIVDRQQRDVRGAQRFHLDTVCPTQLAVASTLMPTQPSVSGSTISENSTSTPSARSNGTSE